MPGSPVPSTATPSAPDRPRAARLPSLTGMRFLAALLVFAFHTTFQTRFIGGDPGDALSDCFANAGFYGVTFFFVLSGFVLTWSARPAEGAPRVWRRRLVKIFPNHLVTFVAAAFLMAAGSEVFTTKGVLANLFLVQAWIPEIQVPNTMNAVSWSLSCELFFYLAFPFLLPVLERLSARRLWTVAGVLAALTVLVPAVSSWTVAGTPLPFIADGSLSFEQIWSVYFFPPVRAIEFVLGMIAARLVLTGALPRIGLLPAAVIAVGGYVLNSSVPYLYGVAGTGALWLAPLVVAAAQADVRETASPFRGRVLVRLGELSFAFYMVHGLVVTYGHKWLVADENLSGAAAAALLLAALLTALALALALYSWVEAPAVRRFSAPRAKKPAGPAPAVVPLTALEAGE
ncbi:peptidoglycan/LPS O-acetylase OafA/YrhL [Streptomyces sp. KhCrAH-43]|uniref:acyltransferase family protein n=1 Tax=unclassified Streptomyces TaxID=2593676 RepID=UPI000363F55C|nr:MULTISPECIES: acyltransferase [unclassified Streptomyces]MYS36954.1 acyltransferase family protein [Streptomyces sp. SID4920]MYX69426.1 acyltransferase family protein [Streptomyces sp. SID8373]RAJ62278.1 peptidoglycan/LPS O-acetylase OafA/YrhL [Streptomyces sp. KhCrAH-43]